MPQLLKTEQIECPQQSHEGRRAEHLEPDGLVIRRGYREFERVAALVPYATIVAGNHAKAISARWQIGIERLAAIADVPPIAIKPFQFVAKENLLRYDKAECGVVDFQFANKRG